MTSHHMYIEFCPVNTSQLTLFLNVSIISVLDKPSQRSFELISTCHGLFVAIVFFYIFYSILFFFIQGMNAREPVSSLQILLSTLNHRITMDETKVAINS